MQSNETRETALLEGFYPEEQRPSSVIEMTDRNGNGGSDKLNERKQEGEFYVTEQETLPSPDNTCVVSLLELKNYYNNGFSCTNQMDERQEISFSLHSKIFTKCSF